MLPRDHIEHGKDNVSGRGAKRALEVQPAAQIAGDEPKKKKSRIVEHDLTTENVHEKLQKSIADNDLDSFSHIIAFIFKHHRKEPKPCTPLESRIKLLHRTDEYLTVFKQQKWDFVKQALLHSFHKKNYFDEVKEMRILLSTIARFLICRRHPLSEIAAFVEHFNIDIIDQESAFDIQGPYGISHARRLSSDEHLIEKLFFANIVKISEITASTEDIAYFKQLVELLVTRKITIHENSLLSLMRFTCQSPREQSVYFKVMLECAEAHSIKLKLDNIYEEDEICDDTLEEISSRGDVIPWANHSAPTLAKHGLYDKFLSLRRSEQDDIAAIAAITGKIRINGASHKHRNNTLLQILKSFNFTRKNCEILSPLLNALCHSRPYELNLERERERLEVVEVLLSALNKASKRVAYDAMLNAYLDSHRCRDLTGSPQSAGDANLLGLLLSGIKQSDFYDTKSITHFIFDKMGKKVNPVMLELLSPLGCTKEVDVFHQLISNMIISKHKSVTELIKAVIQNSHFDPTQVSPRGTNLLEHCLIAYLERVGQNGIFIDEPVDALWCLYLANKNALHKFMYKDHEYTAREFIDKYPDEFNRLRGKILESETQVRQVQAPRGPQFPGFLPVPPRHPLAPNLAPPRAPGFFPVPPRHPLVPNLAPPRAPGFHPVVPGQPAQPPRPALQMNAVRPMHQDKQSTHSAAVHRSVSASARKLFDKYFPEATFEQHKNEKLKAIYDVFKMKLTEKVRQKVFAKYEAMSLQQEIVNFLTEERVKDFSSILSKHFAISSLKEAFEKIGDEMEAKAFHCMLTVFNRYRDFVDSGSQLSFIAAFIVAWEVIHDREVFKSDEDQQSEERLLMCRLAELGSEYGEGASSCASGIFNGLIEFLDKKHPLVQISRISASNLLHFIKDGLDEAFLKLEVAQRNEFIRKLGRTHIMPVDFINAYKAAFIEEHKDEIANETIKLDAINSWFELFTQEDTYKQCPEINRRVDIWESEREEKDPMPAPGL